MAPSNSKTVSIRSVSIAVDEAEEVFGKRINKKHVLGIFLLLVVVVLWQMQTFLGSSILHSNTFAKPLFLTYCNIIALLPLGVPTLIKETRKRYREGTLKKTIRSAFTRENWRILLSPTTTLAAPIHGEAEALLEPNYTYGTLSTETTTAEAVIFTNKGVEVEYLPFVLTLRLALKFFLLYSSFSYLAQAALQYTTVASSTILGSTSSIWALILGAFSRTEKFTWKKLAGVVTCLAGVIVISSIDFTSGSTDEPEDGFQFWYPSQNQSMSSFVSLNATWNQNYNSTAVHPYPEKSTNQILIGDGMCLIGSFIYGIYTIVLKHGALEAGHRVIHMPTFFSLVGLLNVVFLFPLFPIFHFTHYEPFSWPQSSQIWTIVLINSCASMVGDIMCAYVVLLTSPLVVTVGLSLQIPLSLVGQMVIQSKYENPIYWVGALVVVASFVFVEREEVKEEHEIEEDFAKRGLEASLIMGVPLGDEEDQEAATTKIKGIKIVETKCEDHEENGRTFVVAGPSTPTDSGRSRK